jgi:hypothetical protein
MEKYDLMAGGGLYKCAFHNDSPFASARFTLEVFMPHAQPCELYAESFEKHCGAIKP